MKKLSGLMLISLFVFYSCSSVRVNSDFDKAVDFSKYKTFAFFKAGIDKVEISDLDKKRILRSVDEVMVSKGFTKSDSPDLLINIFTKEREEVNVNQFNSNWGYGWGFGWNPFGFGMNTSVYTQVEGTLYIDLIDAQKKEMIWQGQGDGYLTKNTSKKDERIKEFVTKILEQYPPKLEEEKSKK
jgi:Domain of unknown function (DUF4136)